MTNTIIIHTHAGTPKIFLFRSASRLPLGDDGLLGEDGELGLDGFNGIPRAPPGELGELGEDGPPKAPPIELGGGGGGVVFPYGLEGLEGGG